MENELLIDEPIEDIVEEQVVVEEVKNKKQKKNKKQQKQVDIEPIEDIVEETKEDVIQEEVVQLEEVNKPTIYIKSPTIKTISLSKIIRNKKINKKCRRSISSTGYPIIAKLKRNKGSNKSQIQTSFKISSSKIRI
jgi:hypothetical protein